MCSPDGQREADRLASIAGKYVDLDAADHLDRMLALAEQLRSVRGLPLDELPEENYPLKGLLWVARREIDKR